MSDESREKAQNTACLIVLGLYLITNIIVYGYFFWAGYTTTYDYQMMGWGVLALILGELIETHVPNKILGPSFFEEGDDWKLFTFVFVVNLIKISIYTCLSFFLGIFFAV